MTRIVSFAVTNVLLLAACAAKQPPPHYVRAAVLPDETPKPAVLEVSKPVPIPGQLKKLPAPHVIDVRHRVSLKKHPTDVVREANRAATETPSVDGYFNAIATYDFTPGRLFQIYTAPQKLTDIQLQPGEKLVGKPAIGDNIRWVLARGSSLSNGLEQQHIYVKPTREGLDTTLSLNTDRRSYIIELRSYEDAWIAAVSWNYPQDEIAQIEATLDQQQQLAKTTTAPGISIDKLNFGYGLAIMAGRPEWVPIQVFDDSHKTYIRFPIAMLDREAPALFVVSPEGETQLVNYRMKNDTYIVDRLFDVAELRLGQKDQEIVRVQRTH